MKTKEFIRIAEENDYELTDHHICGELILSRREEKYGDVINTITISKITKGYIAINNAFSDSKDLKMFKASIEFAETPIEDREEEKKFLIQHKYLVSKASNHVFMVRNKLKDVYRPINCRVDNPTYQAQFTLKEIEDIKKKLDTDLADFELVEVEDE